MCNLYSLTKGQQAIRDFVDAVTDTTGNLPPLPGIFPDQSAPVVHTDRSGERVLTMMRWGFPPPPNAGSQPVTNIRNVKSPYWRAWLKPEWRVVVPLTSFCEYEDTGSRKVPVWFAADESRPLRFFAGLWRPWTGTRRKSEGEMEHRLFAFLTCPPNAVVAPIHPKAMPVILTTRDEVDLWLTGPAEAALALQRPLPDEALRIVARGERHDEGRAEAS